MRESYNTKTKELILNEMNKLNDFTANDIYISLNKKNMHVGLTTIYRSIEKFNSDGIITKYFDDSKMAHYKLIDNCQNMIHFYLKCNKCNNIEHIDCDCINEFKSHIELKHKFSINIENIVISGLCSKCKNFIKIR